VSYSIQQIAFISKNNTLMQVFEQAAFKAAKERAESDQTKTLELVGELQRQLEAARQQALFAQEQTYQESLREDSAVSMWSKEVEFLNTVLESQCQSHTRGEHYQAKKR
jgi:hypothetical protein